MKKNKFRIRKCLILENEHVYPCHQVQMKFLGFAWITVKEFVEYYPDMGYHVSAQHEAEDLLERLVMN